MLIKAGEIISKSIELYKKNWQLFIRYAVLLLIPSLITTISYILLLYPTTLTHVSAGQGIFNGTPFISYLIIAIAASIASLWFSIAFVRVIISSYEEKSVKSIKEEIMDSTKLIIPVILTSILVGLIILGGALLLIIPGIIFSIWYAFAFYAVVVDGKKVKESLGASKTLVKGRWWGVLWRLLWPGLVFAVLMSVASWIFTIPFNYLPQNLITVILAATVASAVTMFFVPLSTTAPSILYVELKKNPVNTSEPPQV